MTVTLAIYGPGRIAPIAAQRWLEGKTFLEIAAPTEAAVAA